MQLQCAPAAAPGGASGAAALLRHHAPAAPPAASAAAAWRAHSSAAWGRVAMAAGAIWKEGGAGGFYAGLRPSLLQVLPSAALSYWVRRLCGGRAGGVDVGVWGLARGCVWGC